MTTRAIWTRVIIITITGANLLILYYNHNYLRKPLGSQTPAAQREAPVGTTPKGAAGSSGQTPITIRFDLNRLDLSPKMQENLLNVYNMMSEKPTLMVEVGGHTDNIGKPWKNLEISVKRAIAVKDNLVRLGIPAERIIVQGYGSTRPIADNKTEEGRAQNRRVEIVVLKD